MKRDRIAKVKEGLVERGEPVDEATIAEGLNEQEVNKRKNIKQLNIKETNKILSLIFSFYFVMKETHSTLDIDPIGDGNNGAEASC